MTLHTFTVAPGLVRSYHETPGETRKVSNSELSSFSWCKRNWWLTYHRSLGPIRHSPVSASGLGELVHLGLEAFYTGEAQSDAEGALELVRARTREDAEALADDPYKLAAVGKQGDLALRMLEGYFEWLAETGADSGFEVIGVEAQKELPMPGLPGVSILAKLDMRVRSVLDGSVSFIDHKTLQSISDMEAMAYLSPQFRHYQLMEHLEWIAAGRPDGARVEGVTVNMLRKVKRTATAKPPFYSRLHIRFNEHVLHAHWQHVTAGILAMLDTERALNEGGDPQVLVPPSPGRDCTWRCKFKDVCPMFDDGSDAEGMLALAFEVMDPMARYKEEAADD